MALATLVALLFLLPGPPVRAQLVGVSVLTSAGSWGSTGATDGVISPTVDCQDCGAGTVTPGSTFHIRVQLIAKYQNCVRGEQYFACFATIATIIQVGPPYVLESISNGTDAVSICNGGEYVWTLGLRAPTAPGAFPIAGTVTVAPLLEAFNPLSCVLKN